MKETANLDAVLATVGAEFGFDRAQLLAPTRSRQNVAWARQVAVYLYHLNFGASWAETGRLFNRDRTTVRHAFNKVEACRIVHGGLDKNLERLNNVCSTAAI